MDVTKSRAIARAKKAQGPCELCGGTGVTLVHHRDENPWNNRSDNLERLCKQCHRLRHHHAPDRLRIIRIIRDELVRLVRRHEVSVDEMHAIVQSSRIATGLKAKQWVGRPESLPKIMPEAALRAFFDALDRRGNLTYQVMMRMFLYTGCRVSELIEIEMGHVDIEAGKILIARGKGGKPRHVLVPGSFRLTLKAYMEHGRSDRRYLFESTQKRHFSRRMVQMIATDAARAAGIPRVHPHMLRHQLLSYLTAQKLTDAQIQLISGHSTKKSLEIYQHISLANVHDDYQAAVKKLGI